MAPSPLCSCSFQRELLVNRVVQVECRDLHEDRDISRLLFEIILFYEEDTGGVQVIIRADYILHERFCLLRYKSNFVDQSKLLRRVIDIRQI